MSLPVVAIVGRPNVGKSSLSNAIVGRRTSIVEPTAGVTRDRVTTICEIAEAYVELVDTGGHGVVDRDDLEQDVERQIQYAIAEAALILFVVDNRDGLTPQDGATAQMLRRHTDIVRLIANKVDEPHMADGAGEFARLGFGEPMCVSAHSALGLRQLREMIAQRVSGLGEGTPEEPVMKIALVGKRNAGKSTFINTLAGEPRVIVSEIPGTTRDSIDVHFQKDGRTLVAIDTAGVRKKNKMSDDIEFYAHTRAVRSIQRADVVLLLIDATVPVGQVDKRLAQLVLSERKPCVLVVNKWDLAKDRASTESYGEYLQRVLPEIDHAPVAFTTATTDRNLDSTIDLAAELFKQARLRVTTGSLNQALKRAIAEGVPSPKRGHKRPKFYYATQVATQPPTIVVFVNDPEWVSTTYERFLLNRLREELPFAEIPIRLMFRASRDGTSRG